MLRRRTKRELEAIVAESKGVPLRDEIDPLPDWEGACGLYERALQHAQEGKWAEANEDRNKAREMTR